MNITRSPKFALSLIAISAVVLTIMFFATDPQSAQLIGILTVIIVMYGLFWGVILLVYNLIIRKSKKDAVVNQTTLRSNSGQQVKISAVLALAPVLVIILNSLGSIGIVELALIVCFECIVIFLIRKKR